MTNEELKTILEKHQKWLVGEEGGERADLTHTNLTGANMDYSVWPLWCGSLKAHIDDRIARQLLYHLMRPCLVSPYVSDEFSAALFTPELIAQANQFHRVKECGEIKMPEKAVDND